MRVMTRLRTEIVKEWGRKGPAAFLLLRWVGAHFRPISYGVKQPMLVTTSRHGSRCNPGA